MMKTSCKLFLLCLSAMMLIPSNLMGTQVSANDKISELSNDDVVSTHEVSKTQAVSTNQYFQINDKISAQLVDGVLTISGSGDMPDYSQVAPWHNYTIDEVIIQEGITSVGDRAFSNQGELFEVKLPSSITRIGEEAFYRCLFLMKVNVPRSLKVIERRAFGQCWYLEAFDLIEGITTIEEEAFKETLIASANLPSTLTSIHPLAYLNSNVKGYNVAPNNVNYSAIDGVVFNKNKTSLLIYPTERKNTSYTLPSSVVEIGEKHFMQLVT